MTEGGAGQDLLVRRFVQIDLRLIWVLAVVTCLPFLLVSVPPLVDVPGHIAIASVSRASPDSVIRLFYDGDWRVNLNAGSEVLPHLSPVDPVLTGWLLSVGATASMVVGLGMITRELNPKGAFGFFAGIVFLFGYPWAWGFLNFLLATGGSLICYALSLRLSGSRRVLLLLVAQPLLLACHALGGVILPALVFVSELHRGPRTLVQRTWPLAASLLTIAAWLGLNSRTGETALVWGWSDKLEYFFAIMRDRYALLDIATVELAVLILLGGWLIGARWNSRQAAPPLMIFAAYILAPAQINGSEAVDIRFLPIALALALATQDWSAVRRNWQLLALSCGGALLGSRILSIGIGFVEEQGRFEAMDRLMERIEPGAQVMVLEARDCNGWRLNKATTYPVMLISKRNAWVNTPFQVPTIHMLSSPIPIVRPFYWKDDCINPAQPPLANRLADQHMGTADYLWLIDTSPPGLIEGFTPIASAGGSRLYRAD